MSFHIPSMPAAIAAKLTRLEAQYAKKKKCPMCDEPTPRGLKVDVVYDWMAANYPEYGGGEVWSFGAKHSDRSGSCSYSFSAIKYKAEIRARS
jgi:hypothetical protein